MSKEANSCISVRNTDRRHKPYRVKEVFYSLQGEGAQTGRAAIFCRFSKCNLWSGRESDRKTAICQFCDTDIVGEDGQHGGRFDSVEALVTHLSSFWPEGKPGRPYVIFTGGEPALQLDTPLIQGLQQQGFEVGIETNGTLPLPEGLDWVCVSPKSTAKVVVSRCHEVKLVFPQPDCPPEGCLAIEAEYYYLSPMASCGEAFERHQCADKPDAFKQENTRKALAYCLEHPHWRLTLQTHKLLGID